MRTLVHLCAAAVAASAHAAPAEWLDGTVLADCEYCKTEAFTTERRRLANQSGFLNDAAAGTGYIVTVDGDGTFVWGRAALVGTGNIIRTDAHVLFTDTGQLKVPGGKTYFEPMYHAGARNRIELDLSSVQRGGAVGPLEVDVKNDWAIARLKEDAIEKFGGDRVFAFLWDVRVTHDDIVKPDSVPAATLVLSREHTLDIRQSCQSVTDDHPSRYAFGIAEVFFIRCPTEYVQAGVSGSALAIFSADGAWNLGGQIVAGGVSERVRVGASADTPSSGALRQQLFLGNAPAFRQTMAIVYLQELLRRGMDPRDR